MNEQEKMDREQLPIADIVLPRIFLLIPEKECYSLYQRISHKRMFVTSTGEKYKSIYITLSVRQLKQAKRQEEELGIRAFHALEKIITNHLSTHFGKSYRDHAFYMFGRLACIYHKGTQVVYREIEIDGYEYAFRLRTKLM